MRKIRPKIQRAFLNWLQENKHRFNVPVKIVRKTDRTIELVFIGLHPAFTSHFEQEKSFTLHLRLRFNLYFTKL